MAKKTYPHAVIYGGVLYPANTPIEIKKPKADEPTSEEAVKKDDEGTSRKS